MKPPDFKARGTAIVTGGRRGIGAAVALQLASVGFDVVVIDAIEDDAAARTMTSLDKCGGKNRFIVADISNVDAHDALVKQAAALGPITCLVNNAGINMPVRGDLLETTQDVYDKLLDVNLRGTFFLTQAVARHMTMQEAPGAHRTIVVISSANAAMVSPEKAVYCLSKSALAMLAKLFAARLAEHDIDVFEVQPGLIRTEMNRAVWDTYGKAIEAGASLVRRWGEPEDVAQVVGALATGKLAFCTGTTIPVGGGLHVHRL